MRSKPFRAAVSVLAALGVVLVGGCGPVSPGEAAQARQALVGPDGSMTFQLPSVPSGFDPFAVPGSADSLLAAAQFEPLVTAVDGRIMPRAADWWGTANEGRTLIFTIRRGQWSDGVRMGAGDLVFTLERHLAPGSRSPLLPTLLRIEGAKEFHEGRAQHVAGIVADTSRGVLVTLAEPELNYLSRLTGLLVLPRHVYAGSALTPDEFDEPRVGSGAYVFDRWGPDRSTVYLEPNPTVQPHTRLTGVVGRVVAPEDVSDALRSDPSGLDVAVRIPGRDLTDVPADRFNVGQAPGDRMVGMAARDGGPLADVKVRQAIAFALDRGGVLQRQLGGNGRVVDSVLFAPDWAASPDRAQHPHDPARARELLAAADWDRDTRVRIAVLTTDGDPATWDALAANLAEVGMTAEFTIHAPSERPDILGDPAVDAVVETYRMAVPDPGLAESWVMCGAPSGYCNPTLDALLVKGRGQLVATERQETYRRADEILSTELPVIPLWVPDAAVAVTKGRAGVNPLVQPETAVIDLWGSA